MSVYKTKAGSYRVRCEINETVKTEDEAARLDKLFSESQARLKADFDSGVRPAATIEDITADFLSYCEITKGVAENTVKNHRRALKLFSAAWNNPPLTAITVSMLQDFIKERLKDEGYGGLTLARGTVRKDLATLKAAAHYAIRESLAPADLRWLTYSFHAAARRSAPAALTIPEFINAMKTLEDAAPYVAAVLWAMVYYGARPAALFALKWSAVTLPEGKHDGAVRLKALKKGDPSVVPVPSGSARLNVLLKVRNLFNSYHGRTPRSQDPVFCKKSNVKPWDGKAFSTIVFNLVKRLKLPAGFRAYSARHSAMTWLKQAGVDSSTIQHYAKHKKLATQDIYDHTSGRQAAGAYTELEKITGNAAGKH